MAWYGALKRQVGGGSLLFALCHPIETADKVFDASLISNLFTHDCAAIDENLPLFKQINSLSNQH